MAQLLTRRVLIHQNCTYAGTPGVSPGNRGAGFVPGFMDRETGSVYPSRGADGAPCPIHVLDGLPDEVVVQRKPSGQVTAVKESVIVGFLRDGCFYTREQAAAAA